LTGEQKYTPRYSHDDDSLICDLRIDQHIQPCRKEYERPVWVFGLVNITFGGNKAPGNIVGNMLFFTLGAVSIAISMAISGLQNMLDEMGLVDSR
jgi:hypothetical protein